MLHKISKYIIGSIVAFLFVLLSVSAALAQNSGEEVRISTNGSITETQQLDDVIFVGGNFSEVTINTKDPIKRQNLTEVIIDSESVTSWNPQPDNSVNDLALYNKNLIVAGQFTSINNTEIPYFVFIDMSSKEMLNIGLTFSNPVYALGIKDDVLYIGGSFTEVNNVERSYLISYNLKSEALTTWNPVLDDSVFEIAIDDSTMYIGGGFTKVNGQPRNHLAAFNLETGELTDWNPSVDVVVTHIDILEITLVITGYVKKDEGIEGKNVTISKESNDIILEESLNTDISPFPTNALPAELNAEPKEATVEGLMVNQSELGFKIPTLSDLLTFAIRAFFVIAGLAALFFLLLGAFAWVTSGGDQDSVDAARGKIQAAVVGLLMMVAVLAIVWTLEQVIFNRRVCLGLSCPLTIPTLLQPVPTE